MKRTLLALLAATLLLGLLTAALAQDQEYALKDYMPQTVGTKWIMNRFVFCCSSCSTVQAC